MKVAYILLRFPHFTETFIAEEIGAIQSRNIDVRIISLLSPKSGPMQPLSQKLLKYTLYAPRLLSWTICKAQLHFLIKSPRLYLGLLATLLRQPYPTQPVTLFLKRVLIFLKAVSVAHLLKGSQIQLLHAHFASLPGAAAWICARLLEVPFTVTMHAYDIFWINDLLRLVSREAARVIAISEFNRAQVAALGACPAESVSVIHCGVDLTKFQGLTGRQMEETACGPVKILSVGSLVYFKGHRHLIGACDLLGGKGLDFICTIIGGGPDEAVLREQIQACGLEDKVKLLGARSIPEIIAAYPQHDLFVLACTVTNEGNKDGIPVVLMEAGMAGLPIISTPVSGVPEVVRHEQTGWLVPPDNPTALADAILALAADPSLRARLGQNARALVEAQFNIETSASQIISLWQKTCAQSRPTAYSLDKQD